jgi:hypothetical protein
MQVSEPATAVLLKVGIETRDGGTGFIGLQRGAEFGAVNDQVPKSCQRERTVKSRNRAIQVI